MSVWFVTRHQGAIDWILQQGIHVDHFVKHLDIENIRSGDTVIGILPIYLAAQVCEKNAKFYSLSVNIDFEQRGTELSCQDLISKSCELQAFDIKKL